MSQAPRSGVVLLAVLVVVVFLSLAAYRYGDLMTAEYVAADSAIRAAQARSNAISGIHYAAAALSDPESFQGQLGNNVHDNSGAFRAKEVGSGEHPRSQGRFSIMAGPTLDDALNGSTATRFGAVDESGKININALIVQDTSGENAHNVLIRLPNMTEEIADAIIDWIDANDEPRPNGAENEYYTSQSPGFKCKNGPLDSLEELLLVRGITPQLLFGTDTNRNGLGDAREDDGGNGFDSGWSAYLTVHSRELNRDMDGQARLFLNESSLSESYDKLKEAVTQSLADFIVLYKTQSTSAPQGSVTDANSQDINSKVQEVLQNSRSQPRSIGKVSDLINGTVYFTVGQGNNQRRLRVRSPLADASQQRELLPKLLDKTTTKQDAELSARININTAPRAVLACLPNLEETDVQMIISARPAVGSPESADPNYQTPAWLITEANLTPSKFGSIEPYITARSQTYRVQSIGYFDQGGTAARVEAVIDTNGGQPRIVYFRDLTELGRGYDLPR